MKSNMTLPQIILGFVGSNTQQKNIKTATPLPKKHDADKITSDLLQEESGISVVGSPLKTPLSKTFLNLVTNFAEEAKEEEAKENEKTRANFNSANLDDSESEDDREINELFAAFSAEFDNSTPRSTPMLIPNPSPSPSPSPLQRSTSMGYANVGTSAILLSLTVNNNSRPQTPTIFPITPVKHLTNPKTIPTPRHQGLPTPSRSPVVLPMVPTFGSTGINSSQPIPIPSPLGFVHSRAKGQAFSLVPSSLDTFKLDETLQQLNLGRSLD